MIEEKEEDSEPPAKPVHFPQGACKSTVPHARYSSTSVCAAIATTTLTLLGIPENGTFRESNTFLFRSPAQFQSMTRQSPKEGMHQVHSIEIAACWLWGRETPSSRSTAANYNKVMATLRSYPRLQHLTVHVERYLRDPRSMRITWTDYPHARPCIQRDREDGNSLATPVARQVVFGDHDGFESRMEQRCSSQWWAGSRKCTLAKRWTWAFGEGIGGYAVVCAASPLSLHM